ncbi:hypothetical protein POM88_014098 [Heracleum sosnowskyi]|uniref:RRM domain-containing protein n=1 Tax=Heracleum sosnowskyi TaxID=360622 RepID=A0AAD8N3W6_9APIA|nr:hypothetical protein POM88_014098 [Heracleum sosnowskyi]
MADVEYRCFVGGLDRATDDESLEQAFSQFGDITDSKIINDRETGRSRGFGFVTFKDKKSMRDAIEGMNGQELEGRNITVNKAQSRGSGGGRRKGRKITSLYDIPNTSLYDIPNTSLYDIPNTSLYDIPNTSLYDIPNASLYSYGGGRREGRKITSLYDI